MTSRFGNKTTTSGLRTTRSYCENDHWRYARHRFFKLMAVLLMRPPPSHGLILRVLSRRAATGRIRTMPGVPEIVKMDGKIGGGGGKSCRTATKRSTLTATVGKLRAGNARRADVGNLGRWGRGTPKRSSGPRCPRPGGRGQLPLSLISDPDRQSHPA